MKVTISGASGLLGSALSASLRTAGHRVGRLVRRPDGSCADAVFWDPAAGAATVQPPLPCNRHQHAARPVARDVAVI